MTLSVQPRHGAGQFPWNAGGWCGSVAGSTTWMAIAAGLLVANGEWNVAVVAVACFVVCNAVAVGLWMRRDRPAPFPALMTVLGLLAFAFPVVCWSISVGATESTLAEMNWPTSNLWIVFACLLVPGLMVWFVVMEQAALRKSKTDAQNSDANR